MKGLNDKNTIYSLLFVLVCVVYEEEMQQQRQECHKTQIQPVIQGWITGTFAAYRVVFWLITSWTSLQPKLYTITPIFTINIRCLKICKSIEST
jgi:hypothetical protein